MPKDVAKPKKNTSKTARVLGLLTSPPPSEEPVESAPPKPKPKPQPPKPSEDTVVEAQVRSALESELTDPLPSQEETPPVSVPSPEPPPLPPVREEEEEEGPLPAEPFPEEGPAEPEPPAPPKIQAGTPRTVTIRAQPQPHLEDEQDFTCFNVMQALVESKAEKYMKLFGLCTCSRCHTDVVALALTNLPAKYVVASNEEMVPLLSVYEGTYSAAVISQVMNACKRVMAYPRHKL